MTEQEAISSLMDDLMGSQEPTTQEEQTVEQTPIPEPVVAPEPPKQEPISELPDIKRMLEEHGKVLSELKNKSDTKDTKEALSDEQQQAMIAEEQMIKQLQAKLGMGEMQAKLEQMQAQEEARKQEATRAQQFEVESEQFKKMHPEIKLDEVAQWAKSNGFEMFLGAGAKGWDLITSKMKEQGQPVLKPDPVTPSSSVSAEVSAFDRMNKGENVSLADFGNDILKASIKR